MRCRKCREQMQLYLAELLSEKRAKEFEQHLAQCAECASEFAKNQQIMALLQNLPALQPPADISPRIKGAARALMRHSQPSAPRPIAPYLKVAAACAATLVLAVGMWFVLGPLGLEQRTVEPSVAAVGAERSINPKNAEHPPVSSPSIVAASASGQSSQSPGYVSRQQPQDRNQIMSEAVAQDDSPSTGVVAVAEDADSQSGQPKTVVASAMSSSNLRPTLVSEADHPSHIHLLLRTAQEREACVPVTLAIAAPRTGLWPQSAQHATQARRESPTESRLAQSLVGTVVANMVVNQYVRETVMEGDITMMSLATAQPRGLVEVVASEEETATD